jgi:hypothetical protein
MTVNTSFNIFNILHQQYAYSISTNSVKWKCILLICYSVKLVGNNYFGNDGSIELSSLVISSFMFVLTYNPVILYNLNYY